MERTIHRVIDRVDEGSQQILGRSIDDARELLLADDENAALRIQGSFALVARKGTDVRLARSLDRPLRYFLAKEEAGPLLVVAERIDEIQKCLQEQGYADQFHPSYTRMVPAHHVTRLQLVGCPDPNPEYRRFFDPPRATSAADLDALGAQYVEALGTEVRLWLEHVDPAEPVGILFSGGLDSGAVLLSFYHALLERGEAPTRLKAFTLAVDGRGDDLRQAREFLRRTQLEMLGEVIECDRSELDPLEAVEVIEDYKHLDVECATVALALLRGIRERYPHWRFLADGDGGDENFKDYPIEENAELTIRSVVNNSMLYQEGWGVHAIKHSLTFSGGLSRACVRGWAPARKLDFQTFSPNTRPTVIAVAESIPFAELSGGSHEALYSLKGELLRRGFEQIHGIELPVFEKRRFQHGAIDPEGFHERFAIGETAFRDHFYATFGDAP